MSIASDIVVKRKEGALTQLPFITGVAKIGIVARSRGKNTTDTVKQTRASTGTVDYFPTDTKSPIRSFTKIVGNDGTYAEGETFYPNIHYVIKKKSDDTIINPLNFGTNDTPSELKIDWSSSPPLVPPTPSPSLVASTTGGFESATTVYYSLTVVDHNGEESNLGSISKCQMSAPDNYWHVQVSWRMVEYASGYKLYRGIKADGSDALKIADLTGKSTCMYLDKNDDVLPSVSPPTTNTTVAKPKEGEDYTIYYYYAVITKMTYKEFTSLDAVIEEHGIGSEISNIARLYMNPEYNNAPVLGTVVPESTNYNSYLDAMGLFEENYVQFPIVFYAGATTLQSYITNMTPIYSFVANLSDPVQGQKEGYTVFALPYKDGWSIADCKTFAEAFRSTATDGKRGVFGVPAGFKVAVSTWINEDGEAESNYTVEDPEGIDITPLVFSGAAIARYCGLRDPSMPLTEKDVVGFTFLGRNFTNTQIEQLRSYGCMVIENNSGVAVVSQSINMSYPELGIEDGEISISVTEDWMRNDLRLALRQYRGKKMLGRVLRAATQTLTDKLRQYVDNQRIAYFQASSVQVNQDPNQKDRLYGYFKYMPVYPINQIQVEYEFTFIVL